MRLVSVASLLFSAWFVAAQKDAPSADQLVQELTQLPDCAVCITSKLFAGLETHGQR